MPERPPGAELSIAILGHAGAASPAAPTDLSGSITALATALACNYAGFNNVTLYQDEAAVALEHSVELSPNASRILRALKLLGQLKAATFEPQFIHQRSYRTGFQLAITALGAMAEGRYNAPFLHLQGTTLLQVLTAAAQERGVKLQSFGSLRGLTQNQDGVELAFSAPHSVGSTAQPHTRRHDVVVVADDPQQQIRSASNAEPLELTTTALTHWRGTTPHDQLPPGAFAAVLTQWLGPDQHLSYHFTAGGELLEFSALAQTEADTKEDLLAAYADWHPSLRALIESTATLTPVPVLATRPVEHLAHGNVLFLGACCHRLSPHLPQQLALGIEDAWVISRMLEQWEDQPAAGLVEFERYRLPRARRMQTQASARADLLCATAQPGVWRRNLAMTFGSRFLPELAMQKNDWLYGYDAINGFE